jgi:PIN domain nuclease of toxin-antitoxin system
VRLLLDTSTLFWWLSEEARLSPPALGAISSKSNACYISVGTAWEVAIKVGVGKWPEARTLLDDFEGVIRSQGLQLLPITVAHARDAGLMGSHHRDPFDRLLAAQAIREALTIVSPDTAFRDLGASCLW